MKKPLFSPWIPRKLEERIVYSGVPNTDFDERLHEEPFEVEEHSIERQEWTDALFVDHPEQSADQKDFFISKEEVKQMAREIDAYRGKSKLKERASTLKGEIEPNKKADLKEKVSEDHAKEKGEHIILLQKLMFSQTLDKAEKSGSEFDQIEEEQEELFVAEEERREFETLLTKKRRERILHEIKEAESARLQLNQPNAVQEEFRTKPEILEIPKREDLELIYEGVFSELHRLGWNEITLRELVNKKEGREELRKLIQPVVCSKLYGKGLCKLIAQKFVYDKLIDWLNIPSFTRIGLE